MDKAILNLTAYKNYLGKINIESMIEKYKQHFYGKWNNDDVIIISKSFDRLFNTNFKAMSIDTDILNKAEKINNYIVTNQFKWDLLVKSDIYSVIKYGTFSLFVFSDFIDIIEVNTYPEYTPNQLRQKLFGTTLEKFDAISKISDISINDFYKEEKTITSKMDILKSEMEDIKNNKNEELAILQKEIDEKVAILNKKKEVMMTELHDKMAEFNEKLNQLKKQIFMLKTEIYSIRCLAGETIELIQIRTGKNTGVETPIVLNQKILYLDEDLAKTLSIYSSSLEKNYKLVEKAIKYNDEVMNMFCPQDKSISFFKCSKSGKSYYYNNDEDMLASYSLLHGNKMGFVVRNGENIYIGWLEEEWDNDNTDMDEHILAFNDNVMFKPKTKEYSEDEVPHIEHTNVSHAVSRYFAMSILQGLIEHKKILEIPSEVNVMKPSQYIIHNYAEGWLEDNRYGLFSDLVSNLNEYKSVGNKILLICSARESNQKPYESVRSKGERNTTRDCHVKSGLYDINLIDNDDVFISVKKDDWYMERKNKANFKIEEYEYIDLTFMNSIWLKYFIDTKKIGSFGLYKDNYGYTGKGLDYAYLVQYFKIAYEYIIEREKHEEELFKMYINNLDTYDWKNILSHWKILNNVREITEYQAKRFVNYLTTKQPEFVEHLFEGRYKDNKITVPNLGYLYFETDITSAWSINHNYVIFEDNKNNNSEFGFRDKDVVYKKFGKDCTLEEIKEREEFDDRKILDMRNTVWNFAKENNIDFLDDSFIKFFKAFKKVVGNSYAFGKNTINYLSENILNNDCKYEDIKDLFNNDVKNNKYYFIKHTEERMYKLLYLAFLQREIYPFILDCIEKAIKYKFRYSKIKQI